jgi:hypothetical protein
VRAIPEPAGNQEITRMIEEVDWARLDHAYGRATDTPRHLAALTSANRRARMDALLHLDIALMHQGFPDSATAPATRVVSRMLVTGGLEADVCEEIIEFLGGVAHATRTLRDEPPFEALIPELEASVVEGYRAVAGLLDHSAPEVRLRVAETMMEQVRLPGLAAERPALVATLREWLRRPDGDRHVWVRLLGDLGEDVGEFLDDPDRAVRVRAALAPSSADDARATGIILSTMGGDLPPGVHRAELVQAAIARVADFDLLAEQAVLVAERADWTGFDDDWGPLLAFAFPRRHRSGRPLSPARRSFLNALVRNDRLWDRRNGSVALVFKEAGLPHDRERCAHIAATAPATAPATAR